MKHFALTVSLLGSLLSSSCTGNLETAPDAATICQPDPVPCLRLATALSGQALWVADLQQQDATATAELRNRADAYDRCVDALDW